MKQKIFMLILCGLFLTFLPSVSAETDAEFLGRMLAELPVAGAHPTDWVQQVEVFEVVPEQDHGRDDDGDFEYENGDDDDCGYYYEDDGECEDVFDVEGCDDGEDNGEWGGCGDDELACGSYEDFCDDAKIIGTSSVIVAATLIINFVL